MRNHKSLRAFQNADELALEIYRATEGFPSEERYGLTSQLRRGAVSVASNIVEGSSRSSQRDYLRFLEIALGSLREIEYQWTVVRRLNLVDPQTAEAIASKIDSAVAPLVGLVRQISRNLD